MLGLDVLRAGERAGHELIGMDLPEIDIVDRAVTAAVERCTPDAVLNCAAMTDVDGQESKREQARAVNGEGPGNLARAAAAAGIPVLHVSTDYVFSGEAPRDPTGAPGPTWSPTPRALARSTGREARGRAPGARRLAARMRWCAARGCSGSAGATSPTRCSPSPTSATRCRWSPTRSAARPGAATSRPPCSA